MIGNEATARAYVAARCDSAAMARLDAYLAALAEENERQNLVAGASLAVAWQRHLADSAQLLDLAGGWAGPWLDLGSGAGLPGLVIAIMRPEAEVVLVESRRKRIDWLERMCAELGLLRCRIAGTRLENVPTVPASVISARAFAPLPRLLSLSARFSTEGALYLLPKGRSAGQELAAMPERIGACSTWNPRKPMPKAALS